MVDQPVQMLLDHQLVLWWKDSAVMDGSEVRAIFFEGPVRTGSRIQDPGSSWGGLAVRLINSS